MSQPNKRDQSLDLFKTVLVWGMIGAHVMQLISRPQKPAVQVFSDTINLVTFSGFMLAFGLGLGLSKGSGSEKSLWQRLRPVLLLLLAAYISSLAFVTLVDRLPLTPALLVDLFSMRRLYGWSEFLASFFVLYLVIAIARPLLVAIARNPITLVVAVAACLAATWIVVSFDFPLIATVVGTTQFASFPIIAYLPWFLVGIYFAGRPLRWWYAVPALAATAGFYWFTSRSFGFPSRFPPSILWVIGPAALLFGYVAVSRLIASRWHIPNVLLMPGRHVLSFLLISNVAIFFVRWTFTKPIRDPLQITLATIAIMVVLTAGWLVVESVRKRRPA